MKKESSRDEEENEDEGSTPKAEEYDPMEAEDADDDDDDDGNALLMVKYSLVFLNVPQHNLVSDEKSCTTLKLWWILSFWDLELFIFGLCCTDKL